MALGSVNVPGVSQYTIDALKSIIIAGKITLPLTMATGETITTTSGEPLEAVRYLI